MKSHLQRLRELRQADSDVPKEWTQRGVAQRIGASQRTIKAWEAGAVPRPHFRIRLARLYGVTEDELEL